MVVTIGGRYCSNIVPQAGTQSKLEPGETQSEQGETQSEPGVSPVPLTLCLKEAEEELGETQLQIEAGETGEAGKTLEAMKTREAMVDSKALKVEKAAEQNFGNHDTEWRSNSTCMIPQLKVGLIEL